MSKRRLLLLLQAALLGSAGSRMSRRSRSRSRTRLDSDSDGSEQVRLVPRPGPRLSAACDRTRDGGVASRHVDVVAATVASRKQHLRAGLAGGGCMSMKCCRAQQDEAAALARVRATGRRNRARRSASSGALAATDAERQVTACAVTLPIECLA